MDCCLRRVPGSVFDGGATVKVCTLEDILAEKIVAVLSSAPAGGQKKREQDLFDVASVVSSAAVAQLDRRRLAELAEAKGRYRACCPSPGAFTRELSEHLRADYERLRESTGVAFIRFDAAWNGVLNFVRHLRLA